MKNAIPNEVIVIGQIEIRYLLEGSDTKGALAPVGDLGIPSAAFPYLCYEFLTDDEYATIRAGESTRDWVAIEKRAELVFGDLVHVQR